MAIDLKDAEAELEAMIAEMEREGVPDAPAPAVTAAVALVVEPVAAVVELVVAPVVIDQPKAEAQTVAAIAKASGPSLMDLARATLKAKTPPGAEIEVVPVAPVIDDAADTAALVAATGSTIAVITPELKASLDRMVTAALVEPLEPAPTAAPVNKAMQTFIDGPEFQKVIGVRADNLEQCFYNQSGNYAYYGELASKAKQQAAAYDLSADLCEAALTKKHRTRLMVTGEKTTEKMVEQEVRLDPLYRRAMERKFEAQQISDMCKAAFGAVEDRRYMLMGLGAAARDENKGQLRIMDRQLREDAINKMGGGS